MVDESLRSFGLTLDYLRRLIVDVNPADAARQPGGAVNHPAWIVGHLTYSCQALGGEVGLSPWLPEFWGPRFGTGSVPTPHAADYPALADLLTALADGQRRLTEQLLQFGEAGLAAPLPDERYRHIFPTLGHAVVHILGGHAAVHVGQLSVWRRAAGYAPLVEPFL